MFIKISLAGPDPLSNRYAEERVWSNSRSRLVLHCQHNCICCGQLALITTGGNFHLKVWGAKSSGNAGDPMLGVAVSGGYKSPKPQGGRWSKIVLPQKDLFTPHAQRERSKVIDRGVLIYITEKPCTSK